MDHYFSENPDVKSDRREIKVKVLDRAFTFITDSGVFSKSGLDFGTRLLIETISDLTGNVLDIGCGYGAIGIILSSANDISVTMSDVNTRAIELSKINAEMNNASVNVIHSDMYEDIDDKFDYIVTNPPIRIGKEALLRLLRDAKNHLNINGELWFVIRKKQGAESVIKALKSTYELKVVEKRKGFYIIRATSIDL